MGNENEGNEYLKEMGIEYFEGEFDFNKNDYVKLDKKMASNLDLATRLIPNVILGEEAKGVYKVVFDTKNGNLTEALDVNGNKIKNMYRTIVKGKDGKIKEQAMLKSNPLETGLVVSNVFSVLSVVTSQYYMEQINSKLENIEHNIQEVLSFLEDDKRCKMESIKEFLDNIKENYCSIMSNGNMVQATLSNIQNYKVEALSNIYFYKKRIEKLKNIDLKKDDVNDIFENVDNLVKSFSEYWISLYLYSYSSCMEVFVSRMTDELYIKNIVNDLEEKCNSYKSTLNAWEDIINDYLESATAFDENRILNVIKRAKDVKIRHSYRLGIKEMGLVADLLSKYDAEKKKSKRSHAREKFSKIVPFQNIKQIEERQNDLLIYNTLNNGKIEIINDNDEIYMKI